MHRKGPCLISAGELVWTHGCYLLPALAALLALLVYLANKRRTRSRSRPASTPQGNSQSTSAHSLLLRVGGFF